MLIAIAAGVGIAVSNSNKHNNANASSNGSSGQSNSGSNSTNPKGGVTNSDPNDPSIFDKNPDFHKVFFGMAYTPNGGVMPDCGAKQGECGVFLSASAPALVRHIGVSVLGRRDKNSNARLRAVLSRPFASSCCSSLGRLLVRCTAACALCGRKAEPVRNSLVQRL